ncbi:sporulation protein SsgA [Kitasatospora sp. RG8]|uniref:plasmid transfer protein TraA n=1 Tax=Kitasatospora sp. RG8 TaxID=2820815 RepID=UPI001AE0BCF2|nr:plasmid transfer protein TraA [Kitasatospora sp. RG8]MBP0453465.1 sporulation protein SsgA [Kitasatospora sp. RG8]
MSTPPKTPGPGSPFPPPRRSTPGGGPGAGAGPSGPRTSRPTGGGAAGGNSYHFTYNRGAAGGAGADAPRGGRGAGPGRGPGGIGQPTGGTSAGPGAGRGYSPLGDPEFFTNADVREFCERGRAVFSQLSFDLAMAHEILQAVLKEVPDADGRPFGAQARARRVARHLKKAADDAKDCAAEVARTYAAFQREYDPEISRVAKPRQPRRRFDFGG